MSKVKILRDGADLLVCFNGDLPAGFAGFGYACKFGVAVRCVKGDRMPARAAFDYLEDNGVTVQGEEKFRAALCA